MNFTVIIATCGRPDRLAICLEALGDAIVADGGGHEVVVVDNAADLGARGAVTEFARTAKYSVKYMVSDPRNKSRALNAGIAAAQNEWLAFTDDDTIPDHGWLREGAAYAERGGCRVFGGRIEAPPPGIAPPRWLVPGKSCRVPAIGGAFVLYHPLPQSGMLRVQDPVPFGANVFVRRDVFADYGGYDDELWVLCGKAALGVDDGEFGVRLKTAGEPIGYCHEALVLHPVHPERYSLWSHAKIGYYYGWRDPLVFFEPGRPPLELFHIRLLLKLTIRMTVSLMKNDLGGFASDLVDVARTIGGLMGRLSGSYRTWTRLKSEGRRVPPCCCQY